MKGKTAQALWQDYQFLTKEIQKFLALKDMELFNSLMNQRGRLQTLIEQAPDDGFKASVEGRRLLSEIKKDSQDVTRDLQILMGSSKRQNQVSQAYSAFNSTAISQKNWKR